MNTQTNTHMTVAYGDQSFDFGTLPPATLNAMLRRGVSHYLGSEQASKVLNKIEKGITQGATDEESAERAAKFEALDPGERRAAIKRFRDANADLIAQWGNETQADAIKAMEAGTVGVSVRGPAVDPLQQVINRLTKAEVVNILKNNKTAIPKKADDAISFPNGDSFTIGELVARRLNPELPAGKAKDGSVHRDRITKEAKAVIVAQEKAAKKAEGAGLGDL